MADSQDRGQNKGRSEEQLSKSDRDIGRSGHPSDQRSGQHISGASSGDAGDASQDRPGRQDVKRQSSSIQRETEGGGTDQNMDRNDSQDAAVELSDRGGIRPERDDPSTYTDRSADRA